MYHDPEQDARMPPRGTPPLAELARLNEAFVPPASAPAATAGTERCASTLSAIGGGTHRCCLAAGHDGQHHDSWLNAFWPAAPTGEEAETTNAKEIAKALREFLREESWQGRVQLLDTNTNPIIWSVSECIAPWIAARLTAQATELAALRALLHRVLDWYSDASAERWDAIEPDIRAALAPRQTTP